MNRLLRLISILALLSGMVWGGIVWLQSTSLPESPRARIDLAIRALKSGDDNTFLSIRESFQSDSRSDDYENLFRGLIELQSGNWELAESTLEKVDPSGEIRPFLLFARAESLYRMGRLSEAEWSLRQLLQDFDDHLDAHRLLGAIYYDLGSYELAQSHLDYVVKQEPDSLGSHYLMGLMHRDFEKEKEACEHFQAALDLNPPETMLQDLLMEYSQSLIAQKEYSKALALAKTATPSARSLAIRARCLWNLDRKTEARQLIRDALSEGEQDRLLCLMQIQIFQDDRDWEQAVEVATAYLEKDPYDAEIRYQLAQSYARLGRQDDFDREIALFQKYSSAANRLTELNIKALQDPRDPILRDELAEVCESLGKIELARMWREAARNCREGLSLYSNGRENPTP